MSDRPRAVALAVLRRIDEDGAYANLALGPALEASELSRSDRGFVTDLVYGTTRRRRSCDALVDRFVSRAPDPDTRRALRLGAYQLCFAGVPPHAAVAETVAVAPHRTRGFVNAVLRRVAEHPVGEMVWPSVGARLSYPDWIVDTFVDELGEEAVPALERMNQPPPVSERDDGYVQDRASQWVAAAVGARPGELIADVCAAPGGKATALAAAGALVVAGDVHPGRARLVAENAGRLGQRLPVVVADGRRPPFAPERLDAVLVDAPCSGLGALRRRPDARWRIAPDDVQRLVALQRRLLDAAAGLVRPGGRLVLAVCTLTAAESIEHPVPEGFEIDGERPPIGSWRPFGPGWRVLPHDADTDGMALVRYRRRP